MHRRTQLYRAAGLACLLLAFVAGVVLAGVSVFPYNTNPFLSRKGAGSLAEANDYYAQISAPATFAAWYTQYFPAGGTRANANYYNAGDLGFGREMHCREEFAFTSCYVVNHGLGAAAPAALSVQDAVGNTRILPTVAMVYDYTIDGQPNDVMFFVYDPAGNLLRQVALDSEGDKFVPNLCLACHGGTYDSSDVGLSPNSVLDAHFLPFDVDSFGYSPAPGQTKADQAEAMRLLNDFVRANFPVTHKITQLIDGWYGGVNTVNNPGTVYNDSYILPAYDTNATDRELYTEVVKHYCRGCHMAQDGYDLETPGQLDAAYNAVFEAYDMPHGELPSHNFWSSAAPAILARRFVGMGQTFVVTKLDDTADSACDADCSLREAIRAANVDSDHNTIVFDVDGTFTLTRTGAADDNALNGDLDINGDLTILGNRTYQTVINGNRIDRVFHIRNGAQVVIQNVTIRGGSSPVGGGLRVADGATMLTLNFSVIDDNLATDGGGLAVEGGATAEINRSAFSRNVASDEGGAIYTDGSIVAIYNSSLFDNEAASGGGAYARTGSSLTLDHATVAFNQASITGGGVMAFDNSTANLIRSIVGGNSAPSNSDCANVLDAFTFGSNYNLFGQSGNAGGCPTTGTDQTLAGAISTALGPTLVVDPAHAIPAYAPRGAALDAIPLGNSCLTPSYDVHDLARPRDADNNGVLGCDIGAVELLTTPIYLPLINK